MAEDIVLAVYIPPHEPAPGHARRSTSSKSFSPILCAQIAHFFQHYKDLELGKWVKINGWAGPEEAADMVKGAIDRAKGR